jgi:protein-arginine kinase activator protein McsA
MKQYHDPVNLRPNDEDRRILDKLKAYLSKLTKQQAFDTAAIRYALRFWEEKNDDDK